MSEEFKEFVNLCIKATSGNISFEVVSQWLLANRLNQVLLLSEGPIDFLFKLKAPIDVIRTLVTVAPSICKINIPKRCTALHIAACSCVSIEVMRFVLEQNHGALHEKDPTGNLPIHCAVEHYASYEVISLLLGRRRNGLNVKNFAGHTPLHIACSRNPGVIMRYHTYLLNANNVKDDEGNFPLHLACFSNANFMAGSHLLIDPDTLQAPNDKGNLPLHMACAGRATLETINKLLTVYRDAAKVQNKDGYLPLHLACERSEHTESLLGIIEILLYYYPKAAESKDNKDGRLPLHSACASNASTDIIKFLLSHYPKAAHETDNNGDLPIHMECRNSSLSLEKLEYLVVEHPFCFWAENKESYQPSCYFNIGDEDNFFSLVKEAFIKGYSVYLVQLLLVEFEGRASTWKDENGNSLLHLACMKSGAEVSHDIIAFLVDFFPDICASVNKDGKTPKDFLKESASYMDHSGRLLLHHLAALGTVFTVELTAAAINFVADAYPNSLIIPDHNGMLPFHHACINLRDNLDVVFTLLQRYPACLIDSPSMVHVVGKSKKIKLR